ncbi:MAG: hypothetical protein RRY38_04350, partial [Oscillospiraceae bacterium]
AVGKFYDELPDSARDYINSNGDMTQLRPFEGLKAIVTDIAGEIDEYIAQPFKIIGVSVAILVLCALANAVCDSSAAALAVRICGSAAVAVAVTGTVLALAQEAAGTIVRARTFSAAFVPVFAGLLVSSGHIGTGAFYGSAVLAAQSAFAGALTSYLEPLTGVILGLSVVSGIKDNGLDAIVGGIKRLTLWVLTGATTIFCGIVKLQTTVTASADSLALRASRFVIGGAVPVIGRTVSEALATVGGGLSVIRGSVGTAGILAIAAIFLPAILKCILCSWALSLTAVAAETLDMKDSARSIRGIKAGVDILAAIVTFNVLCFVIATAVMINIGVGTL